MTNQTYQNQIHKLVHIIYSLVKSELEPNSIYNLQQSDNSHHTKDPFLIKKIDYKKKIDVKQMLHTILSENSEQV